MNSVEINRDIFSKTHECTLGQLPVDIQNLFSDTVGSNHFYYNRNYSLHIAQVIKLLNSYPTQPFLRRLNTEAKTLALMALQLAQYVDDELVTDGRLVFRRAEVEAIDLAITYIQENLNSQINLEDWSQAAGLNRHKLQDGFKHLFNTTVNKYIQNSKLDEVSRLLVKEQLNITEITAQVGIESKSYLAKIFKLRYGISPKKFQLKYNLKGKSDE